MLFLCSQCGEHHLRGTVCSATKRMALSSAALVALLGLTACNEKGEKDTGSTDTAVDSDTSVSALYGVPNTEFFDADGD